MMKVLYKYILTGLAITGLLLFVSCKSEIDEIRADEKVVYMTFQMGFAENNKAATRAQGPNPSINTDDPDWEDYVNKLAVLAFESAGAGAKVAEEYTALSFFTMKMKPGNYDFYFIANYPDTDEASIKGMNKAAIETYLQKTAEFQSFQGAKTSGVLFPMARVYRNQTVTEGGTYANPLPFKPNVGALADKQLKPISLFGQDWQGTTIQEKINLVRANAKIELNISGEGKTDIAKIEYVNAAQNYTFAQLPETSLTGQTVAATQSFAYTLPAGTENLVTKLYVPERLFAATETKGWDTVADAPQGGVNYIQITMTSGRTYRIPVISNGPLSGSTDNYLTFARDNSKADYNIIRNNHYYYNINIPMDSKEIEVNAVVLPWTLVESEMSYQTPSYSTDISFPEGGGEIMEIKIVNLHQQNYAKISFRLMAPVGAIWSASLTNGLDFSLTPAPDNAAAGETGAVTGVADPNATYTMYVKPLKTFEGTPHLTEFYITVNGKEIQIVPGLIASGTPSGPGQRTVFKQVE